MRALLLGLFFIALSPAVAAAQDAGVAQPPADDEAAREHFASGRAYYERAQYEDAAREFGEAYRLSVRPALLLNLSRAWEGALRFDLAAQAMRDYLAAAAPDDPDRDGADERLARLSAMADRQAQERAAHAAEVHAQGAHHPPPRPPPPPAPTGLTDMQLAGIGTIVGAGVVGVVSLILGVVADAKFHDLDGMCPAGLCPGALQGDIDSGNALAVASTLLTGAAIVAGITGLVFIAFGGRHAPPPPPPAHPATGELRAHFLGTGVSLEWGL